MRSRPLIFLDIESTGLEIQKHEIIEIGALKVNPKRPFNVLEEFEVKVAPERLKEADEDALKIVGFSKEEWAGAVTIAEALKKLDRFAEGGTLVGFNVTFDWAMLDRAYFLAGRTDPFHYHRLDVMSMVYEKLYSKPSIKRFSLGEVCKYLGIERKTKHRALDDARVTYLAFKKLFELQ